MPSEPLLLISVIMLVFGDNFEFSFAVYDDIVIRVHVQPQWRSVETT